MGHHHESDTPTSARAILHHTDQKGTNILEGSVLTVFLAIFLIVFYSNVRMEADI